MDILAHGLWGGAVFGQRNHQWKWAFFLGMCPDLFSFSPFFLTHLGDIGQRWAHHRFGPPDHRMIPAYVYHAYNVTHSLVVWALLVIIVGMWRSRVVGKIFPDNPTTQLPHAPTALRPFFYWPLGAWALHILCDIPTHSIRFFPTPYLWPFHTPFVNGTPWARSHFMLANYACLGLTYLALLISKHFSPSSASR